MSLRLRSIVIFPLLLFPLIWNISLTAQGHLKSIDEGLSPLFDVEQLHLPVQNNEKLRKQYKFYEPAVAGEPMIFAERIDLSIRAERNGHWESSITGDMVWRQRISSPSAFSLSLGFTQFKLPPSAALFIYDPGKELVIGPIHSGDNDSHNQWWSPLIPGDEVIIELQIAPHELKEIEFELSYIHHDFSGFGALLSASCNLDVICGADDGFAIVDKYRDLVNSVGQIIIGGTSLCTGVLLNNTAQDCTPYFLTADHCGVTTSNASSVIVYWNYQNDSCRPPNSVLSGGQGNGNQNMFNSGSILRARYAISDFTLIELDDPVEPSINPYYAGWNWETEDVDSSFTIHHPQGEEKRISFDFDPAQFNVDGKFVRVLNWEIGTTEKGSSGSPLFDTHGHFLGQLNGGSATCVNNLEDDFGMFKLSWEGGGTPDTRLKDWLDPINVGTNFIDGRFCRDIAVVNVKESFICKLSDPRDTLELTVVSGFSDAAQVRSESPEGVNVTFSNNMIQVDQNVEVYIEVTDDFENSSGFVTLIIGGSDGITTIQVPFTIASGLPGVPVLQSPNDLSEDLNFDILFQWIDNESEKYVLEISEDNSFANLYRSEPSTSNSVSLRNFEPNTEYFWRVNALNTCGVSTSVVFSFRTGEVICKSYKPEDIPITIGNVPVTIRSNIEVADIGEVGDVNVIDITGTHTWISDLSFYLVSPEGIEVVLAEAPCFNEDNFFMSFDDNSELVNLDCPLTSGRTFKPFEPLSNFNTESTAGTWQLVVEDGASEDAGSLNDWSLELCFQSSSEKSYALLPSQIQLCDKNPEELDIVLALNGNWTNPTNPVISTSSGISIAATVSPDPIGTAKEVTISVNSPEDLVGVDEISLSFSDSADIVVESIPIEHIVDVSSPELTEPADGAEKIALIPQFSWSSDNSNDNGYKIAISRNEDLGDPFIEEEVSSAEYRPSSSFEQSTTYYWGVQAIGDCADVNSQIFSFTTDSRTSTIDPELAKISVVPTIVEDFVTIQLNDQYFNKLQFGIYSASGQRLRSGSIVEEVTSLDLSGLVSGIYLLSLQSDKGLFVHKIFLQ